MTPASSGSFIIICAKFKELEETTFSMTLLESSFGKAARENLAQRALKSHNQTQKKKDSLVLASLSS